MIAERVLESIDQADAFLVAWAEGVPGGAEVRLAPPEDGDGPVAVSLHLLAIRRKPSARGPEPPPLRLDARYLVSTSGEPLTAAHALLGALAFAALAEPSFDVDPDVPASLWRDLGVGARAGFIVGVEVVNAVKRAGAPRVTQPIELVEVELADLVGRVTTAGDVPVPGVVVAATESGRLAVSDRDGRFALTVALRGGRPPVVTVTAEGRSRRLELATDPAEPVEVDLGGFVLLLDHTLARARG